jgi:putative nucleotidyltransferase with HDIG domain
MLSETHPLLEGALAKRFAGSREESAAMYEDCFRLCVATADQQGLMEAVLGLGHTYREGGEAELAAEYYQLAFEVGGRLDDAGVCSRALNGLGIVSQLFSGDIETAERLYREARKLAVKSSDPRGVGNTDLNLGTLSSIRGRLEDAIRYYQSALQCFEQLADQRGMVSILNNLGMLHVDLQELDKAQDCLDRAIQISQAMGDLVSECVIHTNRAELFLARGDLAQARASCDIAFEMASRLDDYRTQAEALKFYGVVYRESGMFNLAEFHLRKSISVASQCKNALNEAEAQRELALVYLLQEKNREALTALNRAHELFSGLCAERDQVDVARRVEKLKDDFLLLVRTWGESIEAKDRYTRGHCQRVAEYACRLAEKAGLPISDLAWFRMGALLHDVGKTEIPEEILNKPGPLTREERIIMERHTLMGDEMLAHIRFPWDIRPMVRSHHERWDGCGYPDGLHGNQIPLTARILRIADNFDALTTTRSYREPLSAEEAVRVMQEDHGSFDPDLLDLFQRVLTEITSTFDETQIAVGAPVQEVNPLASQVCARRCPNLFKNFDRGIQMSSHALRFSPLYHFENC